MSDKNYDIVYADKEEYEEMHYLNVRDKILHSIVLYNKEEVGPDYESEGYVKIKIERIYE